MLALSPFRHSMTGQHDLQSLCSWYVAHGSPQCRLQAPAEGAVSPAFLLLLLTPQEKFEAAVEEYKTAQDMLAKLEGGHNAHKRRSVADWSRTDPGVFCSLSCCVSFHQLVCNACLGPWTTLWLVIGWTRSPLPEGCRTRVRGSWVMGKPGTFPRPPTDPQPCTLVSADQVRLAALSRSSPTALPAFCWPVPAAAGFFASRFCLAILPHILVATHPLWPAATSW